MRKTRRHKYFQISVFFLIYSIIHVVSISNHENDKNQPISSENHTVINAQSDTEPSDREAHIFHNQEGNYIHSTNSSKSTDTTKEHSYKILKVKDKSSTVHDTVKRIKRDDKTSQSKTNSSDDTKSVASDTSPNADNSSRVDEKPDNNTSHEAKFHVLGTFIGHAHNAINNTNTTQKIKAHHDAKAHILGSLGENVHGSVNNTNSTQKLKEHNDAKLHVLEQMGGHLHSAINNTNSTEKIKAHNDAKLHILGDVGGNVHGAINNTNSTRKIQSQQEAKLHVLEGVVGHVHSTINNSNCTQPAIKQFPHPIMSLSTIRHGGFVLHVIVAVYMFLGLAIVCDEYFVASLDRICEELKMSPDVAGATFMAAGSSAPELATVIIGVFLAQDDIGISGVIGSAVFNIMFVIACCGLCSSVVIYLNWWPLIRDCFFYAVSILVMLGVIYDESISWVESLVLLFTYLIYCVALHYNTLLESIAYSLPVPFRHVVPNEQSGLVSYKTLDDDGKLPNYGMEWSPEKQQENADQSVTNFGGEWSPERHQQGLANQLSGPALNQATMEPSPQQSAAAAPPKPIQPDYYKPKEYDPSTQVNPLIRPEGAGYYRQFVWAIVYPIHWLCRLTMPDCRSEKYRNWYPFTFFISMVWISFYSYFMVWMITLIGYALYIPDTVMGLTFVAAGVSVPDALSSIAVIKEGYGDMAVSNAVGSNVFDILVCLGLPWFLKTAIVNPGSTVTVKSKGLTYSTLSLLSTVVFLVVATHMNGWKLDRRYGIILMIWYLIFIAFASMYEFNFNPKQCYLTSW